MGFQNLVEVDQLLDEAIYELEQIDESMCAKETNKRVKTSLKKLYQIKEFYRT